MLLEQVLDGVQLALLGAIHLVNDGLVLELPGQGRLAGLREALCLFLHVQVQAHHHPHIPRRHILAERLHLVGALDPGREVDARAAARGLLEDRDHRLAHWAGDFLYPVLQALVPPRGTSLDVLAEILDVRLARISHARPSAEVRALQLQRVADLTLATQPIRSGRVDYVDVVGQTQGLPVLLRVVALVLAVQPLQRRVARLLQSDVEVVVHRALLGLSSESSLARHGHGHVMHVLQKALNNCGAALLDGAAELLLGGLAGFAHEDVDAHVAGRDDHVRFLDFLARGSELTVLPRQALVHHPVATCVALELLAVLLDVDLADHGPDGVQVHALEPRRGFPADVRAALRARHHFPLVDQARSDVAEAREVLGVCHEHRTSAQVLGIFLAVRGHGVVEVELAVLQLLDARDHLGACCWEVILIAVLAKAGPHPTFARRLVLAQLLHWNLAYAHCLRVGPYVRRPGGLDLEFRLRAPLREARLVLEQAVVEAATARLHILAVLVHVADTVLVRVGGQSDVADALRDEAQHLVLAALVLDVFLRVGVLQARQDLAGAVLEHVLAQGGGVLLAHVRNTVLQAPVVVAREQILVHLLLAAGGEARVAHVVLQAPDGLGVTGLDVTTEGDERGLA
mmetsp:Transcript_97377/g.275526  ORF Transcript_97377/g.275526 Transcript_97377/m.275526 type:complete len:628 (+) Transcript_97377:226-2109(+)